jgi:hypothetical protein
MRLRSKVRDRIEVEDEIFSEDAVSDGLHIEEILQRAHQIHRDQGGLIGYDLEDWLQAEREWMGETAGLFPDRKNGSRNRARWKFVHLISNVGKLETTNSVPDQSEIES